MYEAVTRAIRVRVTPVFDEQRSNPDNADYFWAYTINIINEGGEAVQLKARHWRIVDALGHAENIRGPGVVGQTPTIAPGDSFSYTSGCPLKTPSGIMSGSYEMVNATGTRFQIEIPAFSLDSPHAARSVN